MSSLPNIPNRSESEFLALITERIRSAIDPLKIVLFGSRARGEAHPDSDYDILVIAETDAPRWERDRPLYASLRGLFAPVDAILFTPEEVHEWSQVRQAFVTSAIREGKVLYERPL